MKLDAVPPWLEPLWQTLRRTYQAGRLPHALLIAGESGTGKRWLTDAFIRGVQCRAPSEAGMPCNACPSCKQFVSYQALEGKSHPDIDWLALRRYSIGIEAVREQVIQRLTLKANYNRMKFVVIEPAERMTPAASNALLKSFEEPPENSIIILISDHPGWLLPTIRSRCQKFTLPTATVEEGRAWLAEQLSTKQVESTWRASGGQPLRALQMHQNGQVEVRTKFSKELEEMLSGKRLETAFASSWAVTQAQFEERMKKKKDEKDVTAETPMDARLAWMIERAVGEVRQQIEAGAGPVQMRLALRAYQELVEVRARDAAIPAPKLNMEAAGLALTRMSEGLAEH